MKAKDFVGKRARIVRDIELRSGEVVKAGTQVFIGGTWRGRFSLVSTTTPEPGYARTTIVSHASSRDFELVALTDADWEEVFRLRCKSKQGKRLTDDERTLVDVAYKEDEERYAALEPDVFDSTVPFGSHARWKR